jgi:outer membrane protein OmpA-like peptidoglycan-associated protein
MSARNWVVVLSAVLLLHLSGCSTTSRDLGLDRLSAQWARELSESDRNLAPAAALQVDALLSRWRASENRKERTELEFLVGQRIAVYRASTELAQQQLVLAELKTEVEQLKQEISAQVLERAHLESEKLRLRNLAEREASERAQAQAEVLLADRDAQMLARDLAVREAALANELAAAQARKAELAQQEAALRGEQVDALRLELSGLKPRKTERGNVIVLSEKFFAPGQAELSTKIAKDLQPLLDIVNKSSALRVTIEGHTDSKGSATGNQKLSKQRADSVRKALIALGANADRLSSMGFGEANPVTTNDTPFGRSQNRRVEVWLEK